LDPADEAGAYAVQAFNTQWWESQGRQAVGKKVGLTSKAVQLQLGVGQPDYGVLFNDMRVPNAGAMSHASLIQPKVEGEVALVFGSSVRNPDVTLAEVSRSVRCLAPAIEIVDSRIADWKISFADTVADNGSSAFFVLGPEHPFNPDQDLFACGMVLEVNGAVASTGAGAACLGHPLNAALWLARTLAARGTPIEEGDIVLTGALGPMVSLNPGDHVQVSVGGLGKVEFACQP
jgi:2-keto-4-pentenoate hydratase